MRLVGESRSVGSLNSNASPNVSRIRKRDKAKHHDDIIEQELELGAGKRRLLIWAHAHAGSQSGRNDQLGV